MKEDLKTLKLSHTPQWEILQSSYYRAKMLLKR